MRRRIIVLKLLLPKDQIQDVVSSHFRLYVVLDDLGRLFVEITETLLSDYINGSPNCKHHRL